MGFRISVSQRSDVVAESVEPDVRDVLVVPGERDTPREAGAADAEVEQTLLDEADDFVHAIVGNDRTRVVGVPLQESVAVARQAEEVVLLFHLVDRLLVNGAVPVLEVVVDVVGLAWHAVQAAVGVELDVAVVVTSLQKFLHTASMPVFGRADEVVVANVESFPGVGEQRSDRVGKGLWSHSCRVGGLLDLEAVFVGSGQVVDVVAQQAMPAAQGVADDRGVRMPEVRLGVDVVDGRRRVEARSFTKMIDHVSQATGWLWSVTW